MLESKNNSKNKKENKKESAKPEAKASANGTVALKRKKENNFLKTLKGLSAFDITMLVLGLLAAIGLVVLFYFMYRSAIKSNRAIPQNGLITSDTDKNWMTAIVNSSSGLSVDDLVETSVVTGAAPGVQVDSRATKDTVEMLEALHKAVPDEKDAVTIKAGYTSVADYAAIFTQMVDEIMEEQGVSKPEAEEIAQTRMMAPGTDEHSSGLLINFSINDVIDPVAFMGTQSYQWLVNNAYKYGYILRYPEGKDAVTLHPYDPTAFRYVGEENAEAIKNSGLTLEEYRQKKIEEQKAAEAAAQQKAAEEAAAQQQAAQEQAAQQAAEQPAQ